MYAKIKCTEWEAPNVRQMKRVDVKIPDLRYDDMAGVISTSCKTREISQCENNSCKLK